MLKAKMQYIKTGCHKDAIKLQFCVCRKKKSQLSLNSLDTSS